MFFRKFYIDLVEGRKRGSFIIFIKLFLFLLSLLYRIVISLRSYLYDKGFLKSRKFNIRVISVGNITWGGTGKTSLVIKLAKSLPDFKIAILLRGYGQDEVDLIKNSLRGDSCKVFASKNRLKILTSLSSDYDLAIFDDGFQYRRVKKDLEIVLVNGKEGLKRRFLLPLGKLREPINSLKRADVVIIMHSLNRELGSFLKKINPKLRIFQGRYIPQNLRDLRGKIYSPRDFLNKEIACFSAIGWPEGFLNSLKELGLLPKLKFIYPDHYQLKEEEFRKIEEKCLSSAITDLIITEKDKLRFKFPTQLSLFILEAELQINPEEEFLNLVRNVSVFKNLK